MKNKVYYGNAVNLGGLYSNKPVRCVYDEYDGKAWDDSGNFDIKVENVSKGNNRTYFFFF